MSFLDFLLGKNPPPAAPGIAARLQYIEATLRAHRKDMNAMSQELDNLKAAVAADAETDAKLVAYLSDLSTKLNDLSAQLVALQAQAVINPADVQAVADQLNAHAADMASHLPPPPPAS